MDTPAKKIAAVTAAVSLALAGVMKEEGWRNDPYRDLVGVWTDCYGETQGVKSGVRRTRAVCTVMLKKRLGEYGAAVYECLRPEDVPPEMLGAFTSFAYNVGTRAACSSTPIRLAKQGKWYAACDALTLWNKAGGQVRAGLVNRRAHERALCLAGLPPA